MAEIMALLKRMDARLESMDSRLSAVEARSKPLTPTPQLAPQQASEPAKLAPKPAPTPAPTPAQPKPKPVPYRAEQPVPYRAEQPKQLDKKEVVKTRAAVPISIRHRAIQLKLSCKNIMGFHQSSYQWAYTILWPNYVVWLISTIRFRSTPLPHGPGPPS